ncbi:MAG: ArnT family glycosyltransferase [Acidimicrobiales bacterium]
MPESRSRLDPGRARPTRAFWVALGIVTVIGLGIRLAYVLVVTFHRQVMGDAFYYQHQAQLLVQGHFFIDPFVWLFHTPHVAVPSAAHPPLTTLVLALADELGITTFAGHQVCMAVIGAGTVFVSGLAGRMAAGAKVGILAAALVALYPYVWVNAGIVESEVLVMFVTALVLWCALRMWRRPRLGTAVELGVYCALAAFARSELALFTLLIGVPIALLVRHVPLRARLVLAGTVAVTALIVVMPWVGRNLVTFNHPEFLATEADATLAVTNCNKTYYGPLTGYWWMPCALPYVLPGINDESDQGQVYRHEAISYIKAHKDRIIPVVAARIGRTWNVFHPLQEARLDVIEGRPLWASQAGLGAFYLLVPLAVIGAFVLRRRRQVPFFPMAATAVVATLAVAASFGNTRYRSEADIATCILAAVALDAIGAWVLAGWRRRHRDRAVEPSQIADQDRAPDHDQAGDEDQAPDEDRDPESGQSKKDGRVGSPGMVGGLRTGGQFGQVETTTP